MKARILVTFAALALVAGVAYRTEFGGEEGKSGAGGGTIEVKTVPVEVRDFPRVVELPGTLESAQQVDVIAQVGGTLVQQHVQEGDAVRAGQRLFTLDARPAQARIAQSQATLSGARAETAEAEKRLERLQPLMASGYISAQEYDDARLALESARARAGTASAELDAARLDVQYAQIRSPIDGRVGRIPVRPGGLVQADDTILTTLVAPGTLDVRAWLAEADWPEAIAARAAGPVMAEFYPDALAHAEGNAPLGRGELVFVDSRIDPATGSVPIKVRVQGSPPGLLAGQGVRLRLSLGSEPNSRVLPEATLQHGQDGAYVYVVRDGVATVQPVRVKRSLDGQLALEGELAAGERVLVEVPKRLREGGKVRLEGQKPAGKAQP